MEDHFITIQGDPGYAEWAGKLRATFPPRAADAEPLMGYDYQTGVAPIAEHIAGAERAPGIPFTPTQRGHLLLALTRCRNLGLQFPTFEVRFHPTERLPGASAATSLTYDREREHLVVRIDVRESYSYTPRTWYHELKHCSEVAAALPLSRAEIEQRAEEFAYVVTGER
jgi:hypothetical protein